MTIEHVRKQDELHDCRVDSIAIADLLMNAQGVEIPETTPRIGYMILTKLERAKELNSELWKALQASS